MKKKRKYKSNLKRRFSFISISSVTIFVTVFSVLQFAFMDEIFTLATRINMVDTAGHIEQIDYSDEGYMKLLSEYETENNLYIEIYSPRDVLFYTSQSNNTVYDKVNDDESETELKPRIMRLITQTFQKDGSFFEIRQERFTSAQYVVYGTFFGDDMSLVLYSSIDVIEENARVASWALFALSCFALIMLFIITFYYANYFTNPLRKIISTTKKIAGMDFNESCPSFRIKELDELSESINILSSSLNKAMTELKMENRQLEMDIETERKLDKTRRSFVANVSHELKTPISIIQGYAEGMKYGIGCDSTEEFCDIIIEEAEKMNSLVVRIMEFIQYGTGQYSLKQADFRIKDMVSDCVQNRMMQFEEQGVAYEEDIDDGFIGYGDRELIINVLGNYLSNALSHVDFEKVIRVRAEDKGKSYRVSVFNSGKPIPGTDIENIWQSFYRADKSHSRKEGRFGLGLSIVAALQELHGEDYGVVNGENGVEFWFDIKKANK